LANYLIIGGNGVIGHFLTRLLVARGVRPVVMSRSGDPALITDIADQCELVRGDVTDQAAVDKIIHSHSITHIAHLGAVLPNVAESDPITGIRANTEGAVTVLEAARKFNVKRVVLASSKAVYGVPAAGHGYPNYTPIPEDAVLKPTTVYGISKMAAEQLAALYRKTHNVEVTCVRFGATIGPGKIARHGGSYSRFSTIIENAMAGKPAQIPNAGDAKCDSLFNEDVARGILCALDAEMIKSDVYNISTGTGFSLNDFAAAVKRRYPEADITVGEGVGDPNSSTNVVLESRRAKEELGFVADSNVDNIVSRYIDAMGTLGLIAA